MLCYTGCVAILSAQGCARCAGKVARAHSISLTRQTNLTLFCTQWEVAHISVVKNAIIEMING